MDLSMVVYDLICNEGHRFEGWFKDLPDLEEQLQKELISCPICDSKYVTRVPSVFGQVKSGKKMPEMPSLDEFAAKSPEERIKELSSYIEKSFENVGTNFANEALKMHYGATPKRNIYGQSSVQEEETLKNEGVNFAKMPFLPPKTDKN